MKQFCFSFFLLFFSISAMSQNLLQNSSFEENHHIPTRRSVFQVDTEDGTLNTKKYIKTWSDRMHHIGDANCLSPVMPYWLHSPDYIVNQSEGVGFFSSFNIATGFTGNAVVGMINYEMIQQCLTNENRLQNGRHYKLSIKINPEVPQRMLRLTLSKNEIHYDSESSVHDLCQNPYTHFKTSLTKLFFSFP